MTDEPSVWVLAEAAGHDVRWSLVQDDDLGVIASITVDGDLRYTAAAAADQRP